MLTPQALTWHQLISTNSSIDLTLTSAPSASLDFPLANQLCLSHAQHNMRCTAFASRFDASGYFAGKHIRQPPQPPNPSNRRRPTSLPTHCPPTRASFDVIASNPHSINPLPHPTNHQFRPSFEYSEYARSRSCEFQRSLFCHGEILAHTPGGVRVSSDGHGYAASHHFMMPPGPPIYNPGRPISPSYNASIVSPDIAPVSSQNKRQESNTKRDHNPLRRLWRRLRKRNLSRCMQDNVTVRQQPDLRQNDRYDRYDKNDNNDYQPSKTSTFNRQISFTLGGYHGLFSPSKQEAATEMDHGSATPWESSFNKLQVEN